MVSDKTKYSIFLLLDDDDDDDDVGFDFVY